MADAASPAARARACFLRACWLDVSVRKPGNVSIASPGHGMQAAMFLASAQAAAGPLFAPGLRVGARIEGAVAATWAAVGCNTNLGIVLLCAPIAAAWERCTGAAGVQQPGGVPQPRLQAALQQVLEALDVADARGAYRGIARANPGGLGRAPEQDVAREPSIGLRAAMALAASRDSIARQYADGFAEVFELGLPAFQQALQHPPQPDVERAVLATFLAWLAQRPDSHIVRKHGTTLAQTVTAEAASLRARWLAEGLPARPPALSSWDTQLKTLSINPGTSADLTAATAFVAACLDPSLLTRSLGGTVVA
jgi:triphosphoribosyl-dephospho-CoA synthase